MACIWGYGNVKERILGFNKKGYIDFFNQGFNKYKMGFSSVPGSNFGQHKKQILFISVHIISCMVFTFRI